MSSDNTTPLRENVPEKDKWNLASLYYKEDDWEKDLKILEERIPGLEAFKGTLGESVETMKACLDYYYETELLEERLGYYAMLRKEENVSDSEGTGRFSRYVSVATKSGASAGFLKPEIQSLSEKTLKEYLDSPVLKEYRNTLNRIVRYKPHILSEKEEILLARQAESAQTPSKAFSALTNADMDFGTLKTGGVEKPLTNSTFGVFLLDPDREVRKSAFFQFYKQFEGHQNTLAELYAGSVLTDIYKARIRGFETARQASLFPDDIPGSVYDNLIEAVGNNLEPLHRYYELRTKVLGLDELHLYDTKVSLVSDVKVTHTFDQAVEKVLCALSPLGEDYVSTLRKGLTGGWVDKYENKGKRSGAFSAGSHRGDPYILMNFKKDDIRDVFTLAHEGGHSMHSWYSVRNNLFQDYNYTIFEAEVASTFNEQLLAESLQNETDDKNLKLYLIGRQIDDILATVYRQTMFAEYELTCHTMAEDGLPLTVDVLRSEYRTLLEKYFGDNVVIDEPADLEGLRIPHFYRAFYVYKYATGLSAAMTLSQMVLQGGDQERENYLGFLKSGGSRFPLESLKLAGVDMSRSEPIEKVLKRFDILVKEFEKALL